MLGPYSVEGTVAGGCFGLQFQLCPFPFLPGKIETFHLIHVHCYLSCEKSECHGYIIMSLVRFE